MTVAGKNLEKRQRIGMRGFWSKTNRNLPLIGLKLGQCVSNALARLRLKFFANRETVCRVIAKKVF